MSIYWDDEVDLGSATLEWPEKAPIQDPKSIKHIYVLYSSYTARLWLADESTDVEGTKANWESITRQAILAKLPDAEVFYYYLPALPRVEVLAVPHEGLTPMKDGTLVPTDIAAMTVAIIAGLDLKWPDYVKRQTSGAGKE